MPVTLIKSKWSSGNLYFQQTVSTGDATVYFGEDDTGVNVVMYGATSTKRLIWDQSADTLVASGVNLNFAGTLATPAALFNIDGAASYFADFAATARGGLTVTADGMSQDPETASEDAFLTVLVGASTYEIPLYLNT